MLAQFRSSLIIYLLALILPIPLANAIELNATGSAAGEYISNIRKVSTDREEDVKQTLGVKLNLRERTRKVQADANINLNHERYLNDSFAANTTVTSGFGLLNFGFVDSFLDWRSSFYRSETLKDFLLTDTPDNRDYRTTISTGPVISYSISKASTVELTGTYINTENSDSEVPDSERSESSLAWLFQYNRNTNFSVRGISKSILDADGSDKYDDYSLNFGATRLFNNGNLSATLGRNRIVPDVGRESTSSTYRLSVARGDVLFHDLFLEAQRSISDTSLGFVDLDNTLANPFDLRDRQEERFDLITRERVLLSFSRAFASSQYTLSGFWEFDDFTVQENDEKRVGLSLRFDESVDDALKFGLEISGSKANFLDQPDLGEDRLMNYRLEMNQILTRTFNISSHAQFSHRRNEQDQSREYESFNFGIVLSYKLI